MHKKVKKILSAYLDGELDEKRRRLVEEHLRGCQECSEELNTLKALVQLARSSKVPEPGEEYWKTLSGRIRSRIILEEEEGRLSRLKNILVQSPGRLKLISTLAVGILVLLVGRQFLFEERGARVAMKTTPRALTLPDEAPPLSTLEEGEVGKIKTVDRLEGDLSVGKDSRQEPSSPARIGQAGERPAAPAKKFPSVPEREEKGFGERDAVEILQEDQFAFKESEISGARPPGTQEGEETSLGLETEELEVSRYEKSSSLKSRLTEKRVEESLSDVGVDVYSRKEMMPKAKPAPSRGMIEARGDVIRFEIALSQQGRGNYGDAIKNYNRVIEENEKLAPSAQFQINLIQSATRDTAMDEKTLRRKAELWRSFVETYQESELIPDAYRYFADNAYELSKLTQKKEDINQAITVNEMYIKFLRESRTAEIYNRRRIVLERDLNRLK